MKTLHINDGDIFKLAMEKATVGQLDTAVAVTTNGVVKKDGNAVMGKGIALQASKLCPTAPRVLGRLLRRDGNHSYRICEISNEHMAKRYCVFSFPTKNDWRDKSDMDLICRSAHEIMALCDRYSISTCYLPAVGCGCGGLDWKNAVEPLLSEILDDRFIVVIN